MLVLPAHVSSLRNLWPVPSKRVVLSAINLWDLIIVAEQVGSRC